MKKSLPIWLTIIVIYETLPMFIGPWVALMKPEAMALFNSTTGVGPLHWMYAARNIAVGVAFVLAFLLKDKRMLFVLILIRLITDLFDLPVGFHFDGWSSTVRVTLIFFLLYYLPVLYALRWLWKEIRVEQE